MHDRQIVCDEQIGDAEFFLQVHQQVDHLSLHRHVKRGNRLIAEGSCSPMIPVPSSYRVYLSTGVTDMRKGMPGLSLQVQEALGRDPHAGDLYVFRGRRGDFLKVLWHDGLGLSLYAKRLERGKFIWPSPADGVVSISAAQLGYLLEGIDWRHPQRSWRPAAAG